MAAYETGHPGYRADLEARHRRRGSAGGTFKAAVARLGLKLPRKAEDLYYKAKTEVRDGCRFSWFHLDDVGVYEVEGTGEGMHCHGQIGGRPNVAMAWVAAGSLTACARWCCGEPKEGAHTTAQLCGFHWPRTCIPIYS